MIIQTQISFGWIYNTHSLSDRKRSMFSCKKALDEAQKPRLVWVSVYSWSTSVLAISFSIKVVSGFNSMPNQ